MASMGSGYDLSVATFSPDGKVFQVEYAAKAVESTGLTLGAILRDGVLLAVDKYLQSKLMVPSAATRVFKVAPHVIAVAAGWLSDARHIIKRMRTECYEYERLWGVPISGAVLADRVGLYVHSSTAVWSTRPFGCSIIMGVAENTMPRSFAMGTISAPSSEEPEMIDQDVVMSANHSSDYSLWLIDPTGAAFKYRGTVIAKGAQGSKSDLEKLALDELTVKEGVKELAKILRQQHQENVPEKVMKIEMVKICFEDDNLCKLVDEEEIEEADREAQEWLASLDA